MDNMNCVDVIIIGRGGGSSEDLGAFNDENLVRAVYDCNTPIVSAVGHQTDVSLCDYAADVSVATPLAAAAIVCPDQREMENTLLVYRRKMAELLRTKLMYEKRGLESLANSKILRDPKEIVNFKRSYLEKLTKSLYSSYKENISENSRRFISAAAKLDMLSPLKVLSRGYSITTKDGKAVVSKEELQSGNTVDIMLSDGIVKATVN